MSKPTITVPTLGAANATEDVKIRDNFQAISSWVNSTGFIENSDLATSSVGNTQLASSAVDTAKLADNAVTTAKIANSTSTTDGITTAKIATSAVTTDKIAAVAVNRSDIRVFTVPVVVTTLPKTVTGTATFNSGVTSVTFAGTSATPQVGQAYSGTGIPSDTVITAVSGSSGAWSLTLNRATTAGASGTYTVAPQDGDECYLNSTNTSSGPFWTMRYSSTTSKWHFVGGAPLYANVDTAQTTTSSTYVALSTAGPSVTVPSAGDYMIAFGSFMTSGGAAAYMWQSFDIGATGAVDADSINFRNSTGNAPQGQFMREILKTGLSASTALTCKYKSDGTATASFSNRWIRVTPVALT